MLSYTVYASAMETADNAATSPSAASFASLLATLATPAPKPEPEWNDEELGEDVASLSYERALRSHARYRPPDAMENTAKQHAGSAEDAFLPQDSARSRGVGADAFARAHAAAEAELAQRSSIEFERHSVAFERNLKNASITIRMSKLECEQLHQRAAEAGLTVSAYLRSCTFEAEALRAQVKEALAELRNVGQKDKEKHRASTSSWFGWLSFAWLKRLFPPQRPRPRVAQA